MNSDISQFHDLNKSPFDAIKRFDETGREFWTARDLMGLLGYRKYERMEDAIDRAKIACKNAGNPYPEHFSPVSGSAGGRPREDYYLTRYACYLVAMNGDVRKSEVASAQTYFAAKTHEAETIIPEQNSRLKELELELALEKTRYANNALMSSLATMHGAEMALTLTGRQSQIVEVEKPIIEVIGESGTKKFSGQTMKQIADYMHQHYGIRVKSGAEISRALIRADRADLIEKFDRRIQADGVSKENLDEVYQILTSGDRQKLIGEF